MGKSNKHRKRDQGPSSKLEEDPILAVALARPDKGSRSGETSASSITVKHTEIDGRSIAVMFHNGAVTGNEADIEVPKNLSEVPKQDPERDTLGKQLEDVLQTLGDEDSSSSLGVRQNAQEKSGNAQSESPDAGEDKDMGKATQEVMKKSYVSLFAKNRLPSNDSKLEFYNLEEGPIPLGEVDFKAQIALGRDAQLAILRGDSQESKP
ncbi:Beta-taxilin like [Actinidia chinensis var. chinensis]|uniref:Beta-taxilin like n=1 Tax=Actinidia chinensis var. chinensis TaxID=1590841 RepID=A0A2R6QI51_ACTCC|nr:Beta-taxilin like [Actinidia chinensis var. chinensis]